MDDVKVSLKSGAGCTGNNKTTKTLKPENSRGGTHICQIINEEKTIKKWSEHHDQIKKLCIYACMCNKYDFKQALIIRKTT